jgi:pimeloyl-ACP methyl ester carboxylesterase
MNTKSRLFGRIMVLLFCLIFLLSACDSGEPTATAAAVTVPTSQPTDIPATETPTLAPTATTMPEPTATETAVPTSEPTATSTPETTAAFEEADCEFVVPGGVEVTCGWLTVPEDRTDPANDKTIRLHIAIFASESNNPAPDPIVYLEGGPGGDALETVPLIFEMRFAPYLENHDLIMFDQRGTGYSQPSLACPENTELGFELLEQDISAEEASQLTMEALLACRERLAAEGVNLAAYNSAESAADLNDLREALGYDEWNVWGVSYGTRLAQTAVRDHPTGIRSIILDSAYPLEVNLLTDTPANVARAFEVFFAGCAADPACAEAFPDLETVFYDTVTQLNEEKINIPVTHLLNGESYDAYFSGDDLLGILFQSLYSTEIIPVLPELIYEVNQGEYTNLSTLLSSFLINSEFFSAGMQFSVQCHEENLFTTAEEAAAAAAEYPELEAIFKYSPNLGENVFAICEAWEAGTADPLENEAVSSDIPTLILAGEYDPITPPEWGQLVSGNLANSYFYEFSGYGHGVTLSGECGAAVVQSFLADPTSEPDISCRAELADPIFSVPGGTAEAITLIPFENEMFGISGVAPEGWVEAAPGVYARGSSGLDQTVLIQQAAPGVGAEQLLGLLGTQLGWEAALESSGSYEAANRTWTLYETEVQGFPATIATAEEGGTTLLVLLISTADEQEFLYNELFIPVLEAVELQ